MRKGQAAMEFLMTYGWAILVVLVAIGALAYFGVLSPARFLPASCTIVPGLACGEFKIVSTGVENLQIAIQNGMGTALTISNLAVTPAGSGITCTKVDDITALSDGQSAIATWTCTGVSAGGRFKGDIGLTYKKQGETLTHDVKGTIVSQVE